MDTGEKPDEADASLASVLPEIKARLIARGIVLPDNWDAVLEDSLRIQPRFKPEPVYARTGVGFRRSVGVIELQEAKSALHRK